MAQAADVDSAARDAGAKKWWSQLPEAAEDHSACRCRRPGRVDPRHPEAALATARCPWVGARVASSRAGWQHELRWPSRCPRPKALEEVQLLTSHLRCWVGYDEESCLQMGEVQACWLSGRVGRTKPPPGEEFHASASRAPIGTLFRLVCCRR